MNDQEYMALEAKIAEINRLKNEYDACEGLLYLRNDTFNRTELFCKLETALTFLHDAGITPEHVKEIILTIQKRVVDIRSEDASKLIEFL